MHPFLQFPQLTFLSFVIVPLLLRIVAGATFAYIAFVHFNRRNELAEARTPILGRFGMFIWVAIIIEAAMALCMFAGYYAQFTALLGIVLSLKHFTFAKSYPRAVPLCRVDYIYLLVICISILFMGAGAFALDLPL